MTEDQFKRTAEKLRDIGNVIESLPVEIRTLAFPYLAAYIGDEGVSRSGSATRGPDKASAGAREISQPIDREGFFRAFDHDKPSDNVKLLAAWLYQEYGTEPFAAEDISQLADDVGLTVPGRIDMTLASAKDNGKALFQRAGKGKFKPTVHGEAYLKEAYSIKKGTKQRPANT